MQDTPKTPEQLQRETLQALKQMKVPFHYYEFIRQEFETLQKFRGSFQFLANRN